MKAFLKNPVSYAKLLIVNSLVTLFFFFGDPSVLTAQDLPTASCQTIYDKAVEFEKAGNFEKAILKYNAVKACDPNFKLKADSIILTVFRKVDARWKQAQKDKEQAEKDKQAAILARTREEQAKKKFEEQVITTRKALEETRIQRQSADSLRIVAQLGQRKADNLSKYYKRKADRADRVLLTRIIEYMHLKHAEDDIAEMLYKENLSDTTIEEWSKSQVLDLDSFRSITTIAVSHDGQLIFTGDFDGLARLWSIDGTCLQSFTANAGRMVSACFSPDNKTILTASQDRRVNLWNLEGELIRTLFTNEQGISFAAFSPDAQKILTIGYYEKTATLWDTAGTVLQTFSGHTAQLTALAFSADGRYVLTGSADSTARLYNIKGQLISTFNSYEGIVTAVAISPNGEYIATNSDNESVWLWNKEGRGIIRFKHDDRVTALNFSADNDYLLTGSADGLMRLWHWSDTTRQILRGHTESVAAVVFVPNSHYALSASYDRSLRLWDLSSDRLFKDTIELKDKRRMDVYLSPNDSAFAVLSNQGELAIYTPQNERLHTFKADSLAVRTAVFSPDGKAILMAMSDQEIRLVDLKGTILQTFEGQNTPKDSILALAFSADGQFILSQSIDKTRRSRNGIAPVKLWNRQGQLLKTQNNIYGILDGFSIDGQSVLTHAAYSPLYEWDLKAEIPHEPYGTNKYRGSSSVVFICVKHKRILTGSVNNKVLIFNNLGAKIREYPAQKGLITALSLSPNGKRIAVGSLDSMVRIWDTAGYLVKVLPRQQSPISALMFSPDNQKIWVCTEGGQIAIYRIKPIQDYSLLQLHHFGILLEPDDYVTIGTALMAEEIERIEQEKRFQESEKKRYKAQDDAIQKENEQYLKKQEEDKKRIKDIVQSKNASLEETRTTLMRVLGFARFEVDSVKLHDYYHSEKVLYEMYVAKKDSLIYKTAIANLYNSLAWDQLLRKEYQAAEKSLHHGINLDSTTLILYTNLAPALLFQGKFEAAKAQYLYWKDKDFNQQNLATYRDAFWADFRSFEDADCIPPERLADVAAIKKLLEK